MEGSRRVRGWHRAAIQDQAAGAADADRRSVASYFRPDLRIPGTLQRGCGLSATKDRRNRKVRDAAIDDRWPGQDSAGIFAGGCLDLLALTPRPRLSHRKNPR